MRTLRRGAVQIHMRIQTQIMESSIATGAGSAATLAQCKKESLLLLQRNLTEHGIMAATASPAAAARRYTRVFGRDVGICTLGMAVGDADTLRQGALSGLLTLARHQAPNGQIPKYVDPENADADFWYIGCIDATLWWLVGVHTLAQQAPEIKQQLQANIDKALMWLHCQEHPRLFLLQQNEASDWADIMPRSGFVLYTNALWYHVKRLYALPHAQQTHYHFNHLFHPFSHDTAAYQRLQLLTHYVRAHGHDHDLYLSFVNFSFWGEEGDVLGNLLAVLFGLADDTMTHRILKALESAHAASPFAARAVCAPIAQDSHLWRAYMQRHEQNYEHQYHNGGIWPFIGGFWALTLAKCGRREQAAQVLARVAHANRLNDWQFNEWLHGNSGEPRGMPGQSWNAAMFLLAQHALEQTAPPYNKV